MDPLMVIIGILCIGVLGVIVYVAPAIKAWAIKKGIPVDQILNNADVIAGIAAEIAKQLYPQQASQIAEISKVADRAVHYAEQLYKSGQCTAEERKDKAIEFVKMALNDAGVPIDAQKEAFIEKVVESAVFLLPKTGK
jgi:hypothetical protein